MLWLANEEYLITHADSGTRLTKGRVWESENGREASSLKCRQYPLSDALHLVSNKPSSYSFISAIGRFPIPLCYERGENKPYLGVLNPGVSVNSAMWFGWRMAEEW